jgi:FKBP-type peptidyl-prolyl cis-trans isomerase 2
VHYVGRVGSPTGKQFASTHVGRGAGLLRFKSAQGHVMKGLDVAVAAMRRGEICDVVVQPKYGYGAPGFEPSVPENATLYLQVELVRWSLKQMVTEDGGVMKRVLRIGEGCNRPNDGATVSIAYRARLADSERDAYDDDAADDDAVADDNDDDDDGVDDDDDQAMLARRDARRRDRHTYFATRDAHTVILGDDLSLIEGVNESIGVGSDLAPVTFISVLCTLRTQISHSVCNSIFFRTCI